MGFAATGEMLALPVMPHIRAAGSTLGPAAIHVVAGGSNDFRPIIDDPTTNPLALIDAAIPNPLTRVESLDAADARRFLVFAPPDFSLAPELLQPGDPFLLAASPCSSIPPARD